MGNGKNQPIQFTRGDAERIERIDGRQDELHIKVDDIVDRMDEFTRDYVTLRATVGKNRRFRRTFIKIALYVLSPSGMFAITAKALGWF